MYRYFVFLDSVIRVKDDIIFEFFKDNKWIKEQSLHDLLSEDDYDEVSEKEALDIINNRRD